MMTDTVQAIQESYTRIKLLSSDLQIKDQTIAILQERLLELEEQSQGFQKQKENNDRQFQVLQEEHDAMFENSQSKVKQLQHFNQQLLSALKEVQDKNQELLDRVKYQAQELQAKQQAQVDIQDQVSLIKDAVKGLEEELTISQKKYNQVKKERQELEISNKAMIQDKQNQEVQVQQFIKQMENENDLLRAELEDYRRKLELQHTELVELKYIKLQHEDLEKKFEQLNDQFSIQVQNAMECEKNYGNQFDQMNTANTELGQQIHELQLELEQMKDISQQLNDQGQGYQKLFNFIQVQINETLEDVLKVKAKKPTVHDRLYEGRKTSSASSRRSVPKKKKKATFNQVQIEEFFSDIKEIIQSLVQTNNQLKEENEQCNKNVTEMYKVGDQLKYRIDQLNAEHSRTKDQLQCQHQQITEQQEDRIIQLTDTIQQLNQKAQKDQLELQNLLSQQDLYEQQIREKNIITQQLQQSQSQLYSEYDQMKQLLESLENEIEELMIRKAMQQNKIALCYAFISHIMKSITTKQQSDNCSLVALGNYVHYFTLIRFQFYRRNYLIYLRFRKVVNAVLFIKRLYSLRYSHNQPTISYFENNDVIDEIFDQYIPQLHNDDTMNDLGLIMNLYGDVRRQLTKYNNTYPLSNQNQYQRIIKLGREDSLKFQTMIGQTEYYAQQLNQLQTRVYQLDGYINSLEAELQDHDTQLMKSEERSIKQFHTDTSPQKSQSISASLNNELTSILNRKNNNNSSAKPGQILKQGI